MLSGGAHRDGSISSSTEGKNESGAASQDDAESLAALREQRG